MNTVIGKNLFWKPSKVLLHKKRSATIYYLSLYSSSLDVKALTCGKHEVRANKPNIRKNP